MVLANSDSNTTLVSLDNVAGGLNDKVVTGEQRKIVIDPSTGLLKYVEFSASTPSQISDDDESSCHDGGVATELLISEGSSSEEHVPLYLPLNELDASSREKHALDIDRYISRNYYNIDNNDENNEEPSCCLPGSQVLKASRDRLLSSRRRRRDQDRLLYVAQGERANATSDQYSVLMSDKATTCHILAFRSRSNSTRCKGSLPMASLTHLDGPHYEQCVRNMIQEHLDHHRSENIRKECRRKRKFVEEEKKSDENREPQEESTGLIENVTIDIHLMGGFDDADSSSSSITEWLLRLLARVAKEFKDQRIGVQMVMKTLVVSSSNNEVDDHNNNCPIGRGLGIDLYTGKVFLTDTHKDSSSSGPVSVLRSVRLWSRGCEPNESHRLSVVHTSKDVDDLWTSIGYGRDNVIRKEYSLVWVQPFRFRSIPDVDVLLRLPDEILLQYTSTSPEVEEAGFCKDVRASMAFLKHQCETMNEDGSSLFGKGFDRPMIFAMRRSSGKQREEWRRLSF